MREDRIPTMPQVDERIPTMPQIEERIPTMPQGSEHIPTMPQDDSRVPTVPQDGRTATVPQDGFGVGAVTNSKIVTSDCNFVGINGGKFTIYADQVISADSGESQIFGCIKSGASEKYVARVLKSITPSSPMELLIRRDKVINFLMQNSNKAEAHILPLVDHGTVQQAGSTYFVEVYPFCDDGDLGQKKGAIPYKTLCKEIIPGINEALRTFHRAGFVHRDVKPDNLYYYDGRVVLGDFGITCEIVNDYAIDRTKTGTLGYYAPELMSQAAVMASDYYSFGQTLWTLYSGEMMYGNILRRFSSEGQEVQRNQINNAMMKNTYYGLDEISANEHFFEILIRGLLQYDVNGRFDYKKVKRWLSGDYGLANEITNYSDVDTYIAPFNFSGQQYWNNAQLVGGLRKDWEGAKELLYSGQLKSFFQHFKPRLSSEIDQIARKYSKPSKNHKISKETMYDIGVSQLLLLLNKGECLIWGDVACEQFNELENFVALINKGAGHSYASEEGFLQSGLVADWYRMQRSARNEEVDEYVLKALAAAQTYALDTLWGAHHMGLSVARAIIQHVIRAMEGRSEFDGFRSLEELTIALSAKTSGVYGYIEKRLLRNPEFYGFLYAQGYCEFADTLLRETYKDLERVELLFYFLEQQATTEDAKNKLLEFYKAHGPDAYLLWFKNNLGLYEFNGEEADAIRKEIEQFQIAGTTITEVKASYSSLRAIAIRFRTRFVDNVYLAKLGLTGGKEKNGITSRHLYAYWHKSLWGQEVPIGFDIS